jgi:hypothetical protein
MSKMPKKKKEKKLEDEILENETQSEDASVNTENLVNDSEELDGELEILEVEGALGDDSISLDEKLELVKAACQGC